VAQASSSDLIVRSLQVWPLREPVSKRAYAVIRLETKSGLHGFGECAANASEIKMAEGLVLEQPATAYEVVRKRLEPWPGPRAAVDMALLDILGKHAKVPVYQLLGGPTRNKARAMAVLAGSNDEQLISSMSRARQAGYRAFLVPAPAGSAPNQGQTFVHSVKRRLAALEKAGGDGVDFALDCAGMLSPGDAASLSRALERFHLLWLDEPCRLSNLGAVRKLSAESVTPIGFGRHVAGGGEFQDLLREEAIDALRPDLALHGITGIRRLAALAETYYTAVAPFHNGGPIATAAALHLAASLPNFFIQQIPFPEAEEDRRMRARIAGKHVEAVGDGFAALPAGPGLGVDVDEGALQ
jgi:galactonate dehydratase